MRRKIRLTTLAVVLLALSSCMREEALDPVPEKTGMPVRLSLSPNGGSHTKVSGVDYERDEGAVQRWAFFIFERSTGLLAYSGVVESEGTVTKNLRTGVFELFVMANYPLTGAYAPNVSAIRTRADFLRLRTSLADNAPGCFLMSGAAIFAVPGGEEVLEVAVRLQRLVCKIHLETVTRRFQNASLASQQMTLRHVYLTNVYPESRYSEDYYPGELSSRQASWYNAMGWEHAAAMPQVSAIDALVGERNLHLQLRQNVSENLGRTFYCYPNPWDFQADSHSPDWDGPRCTRLILETELGGHTYYYQATLSGENSPHYLSRNRAFRVFCTLNHLGSKDPEQEIPGALTVQFIPEAQPWEADYSIQEQS